VSIKETKPKILNTVDSVITNLQGEYTVKDVEWQAVMIARECLASSSTGQLAKAVAKVSEKLRGTALKPSEQDKCPKCGSQDKSKPKQKCWHNPHPWHSEQK
jgi:hypothetical protein